MAEISLQWDERKNAQNRRTHGVSFPEAVTVFYDDNAILTRDPDHSGEEDRFLLLGLSSALRRLVVCHCYRESDRIIRITSARKATRPERGQYERRWKT